MSTALTIRPELISLARLRMAAYNAPLVARGITAVTSADCYFDGAKTVKRAPPPKQSFLMARDTGPTLNDLLADPKIRPETSTMLRMLSKEF
ncbi:MAG TPA: hypothetical protein VMT55_02895, partial [Candidatus Sulfotelmatobacter sp.]|nr:hypothetical protein [Candidatus Sulfotelmatobacter sp.]